jgi:hypothetical protein
MVAEASVSMRVRLCEFGFKLLRYSLSSQARPVAQAWKYTSFLNKVLYRLQLMLQGCSRLPWLSVGNDMRLADGSVIVKQATWKLAALRTE